MPVKRGRSASPARVQKPVARTNTANKSPARAKTPARGKSPAAKRAPAVTIATANKDVVVAKVTVTPSVVAAPVKKRKGSKKSIDYEFGGPIGAATIFVVSHVLMYYVYYVLNHNGGAVWTPKSLDELTGAISTVAASAAPTWRAAQLYFGFLGFEAFLAVFMPGYQVTCRPDELGNRMKYNCNSILCWYASLAVGTFVHYFGYFDLTEFIQNYGSIMTVAILFADFQSVAWYLYAFASKQTLRLSGNHFYDFYMGAILHPRLFNGALDIKMFAEVRLSWYLLFTLTTSATLARHAETGVWEPGLLYSMGAHFLYTNACAKGEHYIPPTWDITYEKYGWMLCFWNWAGVPFLYAKGAIYLYKFGPSTPGLPLAYFYALWAVLFAAYYVWDTAQSQKNHFRLVMSGSKVPERNTYPKLPWRSIESPKFLTTAKGTPLLVDGWWAYARKVHYSADIIMSLTWATCTGFGAAIPYIYPLFFFAMIMHRYQRDLHKCATQYGADWERYIKVVPYAFIPGVL